MIITLDYGITGKTLIQGSGTGVAYAEVQMMVYSVNSKRLFNLSSQGTSKTTLKVVLGNVAAGSEKMPDMLQETTDVLAEDIKKDLPKRIKKLQKKLVSLDAKAAADDAYFFQKKYMKAVPI